MGAWARMGAWLSRKSVLRAPHGLTNAVSFRAGCHALRCKRQNTDSDNPTVRTFRTLGNKIQGQSGIGRGCQALSLHLHFSGLPPPSVGFILPCTGAWLQPARESTPTQHCLVLWLETCLISTPAHTSISPAQHWVHAHPSTS